jgi:hypothetical protein
MILGNLAGGLSYYKGDTVGVSINGIEDVEETKWSEIQIYPNPNNGMFTIAPAEPMAGRVEIRIYDALGALVMNLQTNDLIQQSMDISSLNAGLYLIDVRSENRISSGRFVIQR